MKRLFVLLLLTCAGTVFGASESPSCLKQSNNVKVVVFAPLSHADEIRKVIGAVGAGKIGNYAFCSFTISGTGRWLALDGAHPAVGDLEKAVEERIEFICPQDLIEKLLGEIKKVHPYDEFGYDLYPMLELVSL